MISDEGCWGVQTYRISDDWCFNIDFITDIISDEDCSDTEAELQRLKLQISQVTAQNQVLTEQNAHLLALIHEMQLTCEGKTTVIPTQGKGQKYFWWRLEVWVLIQRTAVVAVVVVAAQFCCVVITSLLSSAFASPMTLAFIFVCCRVSPFSFFLSFPSFIFFLISFLFCLIINFSKLG